MFRVKSKSANPASTLEGRSNVLGQKDRKQLRQRFVAQFPAAGVEVFDALFPPEGSLSCVSLKGRSEEFYRVAVDDSDLPMCLTLSKNKKAPLVPTLFALWRQPDLLPTIWVVQDAPKYLYNGADLMLPGCLQPPQGNFAAAGMDQGQIWAVKIRGNPMPFAVGEVQMTKAELETATKGVILKVVLIAGDAFSLCHPEVEMPPGISNKGCVPLDEQRGEDESFGALSADEMEQAEPPAAEGPESKPAEDQSVISKDGEEGAEEEEEGEEESPTKETRRVSIAGSAGSSAAKVPPATIEELVLFFLMEVAKKKIAESQLPMDASAIWGMISQLALVAMPKCQAELAAWLTSRNAPVPQEEEAEGAQPAGDEDENEEGALTPFTWQDVQANFELKKTTWRDMKRMANHFKKTKIWQLRELRGQISIIKINTAHPIFQKHRFLPDEISPSLTPQKGVKGAGTGKGASVPAPSAAAASAGSPKAGPGIRVASRAYQATATSREFLESGGLTDPKALLSEKQIKELLSKAFRRLHSSTIAGDENPEFPDLAGQPQAAAPAKETDEENIPVPDWVELLRKEQKLLPICIDKSTRQKLKSGEIRDLPPLTNDQIVDKFIHNAMKTVTILVPAGKTLDTANPNEVDLIEADAKVVVDLHKTKRFVRTRISGIHHFEFVDIKALAEKLQKTCAASATTCELEDFKGKNKPMGIVVQGQVIDQVCQVLEQYAGIPRNLIET